MRSRRFTIRIIQTFPTFNRLLIKELYGTMDQSDGVSVPVMFDSLVTIYM